MFAVIVRAEGAGLPSSELAFRLAPFMGVDEASVAALLRRGSVTVADCLGEAEARALTGRLGAQEIRAEVISEGIDALAPDPFGFGFDLEPPARVATPDPLGDAHGGDDILAGLAALPEAPSTAPAPELAWSPDAPADFMGAPPALAISEAYDAPEPAPAPRVTSSTRPTPATRAPEPSPAPLEAAPEPAPTSSGGWAMLYPDLETPEAAPATPAATPAPKPAPSFGAEPATPSFGAEPAIPSSRPSFGAEPAPAPSAPPARPASGFGATPAPSPASPAMPAAPMGFGATPGMSMPKPTLAPEPLSAETGAVAARLAMAFAESERDTSAPPHKPEGFVDHYPHFPVLAAALSALGPGAGQIYNGQPERALGYALSWPLIKPWIESVRDARERAAKIEGYWLPRPPDGALLRAVRHVVIVQAIVWGLVSFSIWSYRGWVERQEQARVQAWRQVTLPAAFGEAVGKVGEAKLAALTAYEREVEAYEKAHPKMSDAERGERLFRVALESCKARKLGQCQALMRRVLTLQPAQRDAVRLMAWAKIQLDHPKQQIDMPNMSKYTSLEDYDEKLAAGLEQPPSDDAPAKTAPDAPDAKPADKPDKPDAPDTKPDTKPAADGPTPVKISAAGVKPVGDKADGTTPGETGAGSPKPAADAKTTP